MEHNKDGEVNFGPLIDLNTDDICPTVKDTTMAKSPVPVGSSTPHSTGYNSDGTVDQVLKAITALSAGMEKQNSALEDRFGELSKRLDALESKQRNRHVTLATDHHNSDIPDLFGDPEEECFSVLPAPLSPSPYRYLPQQREKPRVRPSPYNGSTSWEDYKAQFELVADLNHWDMRTKAAYLAVSLSGQAQAVLGDLDKTQRTSYTDLVAALDSRFGTSNRTEMFRVSLRSRIRKPEETLPELAQAIRRLTRQAYPDATVSLRESIAKDQFIEALADPELRWKVHQARAVTLTEALDAAVEVEAFFSAEKQRSSKPKILQAVTSQSPRSTDATLRQEVQELKTMVQRLAQHPRSTPDTPPHGWQRTAISTQCWMCGAQGHIQRYCPKRFEDRLRTSSIKSLQPPKERPGNETLSSSRAGARQNPQHYGPPSHQ